MGHLETGLGLGGGERVLMEAVRRTLIVEHQESCWYLLSKPHQGAYTVSGLISSETMNVVQCF